MSEYTRPERAAELHRARALLVRIEEKPCWYCTRRVEGFGRAACGLTPQQSFPACAGKWFELDQGRAAA